ncbi:DNA polymerase III subunit epsilon [Rhodoblastus sp.]|uniref:DNA polymerase III subunit epsilon n=1 Tax=Rhodoblastus sp. TaxID=1962975 RepID=UPI0026374275|nr:DNA polymerase III subunit epsilon [Rhodoblastus sp.]
MIDGREIIIDTETTGLSADAGDRIVEIACIEIIDGILTNNVFHKYINPERDIPDSAFRVHGISFEMVAGEPKFHEIADELIAFIGASNIVAHNAEFDMRFINSELARCGRSQLSMDQVVDTLVLARRKFPGSSNSLDALCTRLGVDRSRRVTHGALIDAEILAEIYIELRGGRQRTLELSQNVEKVKNSKISNIMTERMVNIENTSETLLDKEHTEYLNKNVKNPIWFSYYDK